MTCVRAGLGSRRDFFETPQAEIGGTDVTKARLTLRGAWIDAVYDGSVLTLGAVGSPLHHLVKTPTSIPARHRQTEERGRLRRLAVSALRDAGADAALDDADVVWSYRAG